MRSRGQKLTKAEAEDLADKAIALSARGKNDSEIARDLELDRRTVKRLVDNGLAMRSEHRVHDRERHISVYDRVQREAWRLYDNCPDDRAQNKASALNAVISAENAKVKLTGAESAVKHEHSGDIGVTLREDTVVMLDALAEQKASG